MLLVLGNFTFYLKVAIASHLRELGMTGELILQSVVKERRHRAPNICRTDWEVVDLNGLRLIVVDAGSIELIAHGAGC